MIVRPVLKTNSNITIKKLVICRLNILLMNLSHIVV